MLQSVCQLVQTKAWMSKHRHEVERKIREEKERQLEPIQRRYIVRQRAAEHEVVQVCVLCSKKWSFVCCYRHTDARCHQFQVMCFWSKLILAAIRRPFGTWQLD